MEGIDEFRVFPFGNTYMNEGDKKLYLPLEKAAHELLKIKG